MTGNEQHQEEMAAPTTHSDVQAPPESPSGEQPRDAQPTGDLALNAGAHTSNEQSAANNTTAETTNVPKPSSDSEQKATAGLSKPPLLCLGAARTGTTSLAQALEELGIGPVQHGMKLPCGDEWEWEILNRAADATFPVLPSYTGKPFTRADWDELCSSYAAVSDLTTWYAVSLIKAYPDAKVILVERDIDSWLKSIYEVFKYWEKPMTDWVTTHLGPRSGSIRAEVSRKFQLGWTQSTSTKDIMGNARGAYERHNREVRELVPPEQLLDFKLKDGWEPLCKFLDKPVPEGKKFPHANDTAAYREFVKKARNESLKQVVKNTVLRRKKLVA